jgi:hypothetical protein
MIWWIAASMGGRLTSSRKYLENFSNGITVVSLYLRPSDNSEISASLNGRELG